MISEIHIENFKSIRDLTFRPGRVTVLIGENGSGKSNILEAIAFAAGAAANKLDNEFLFNRGIRVTEETWMRCAFPNGAQSSKNEPKPIKLSFKGGEGEPIFVCNVSAQRREEDHSFAGWAVSAPINKAELQQALQEKTFAEEVERMLSELQKRSQAVVPPKKGDVSPKAIESALRQALATVRLMQEKKKKLIEYASLLGLANFIIYAPESTILRTPPPESAIQPIGTRGEGLFKLLQSFTDQKFSERLLELKQQLHLFGWFDDFMLPDSNGASEASLHIRDRWLGSDCAIFDQRSANEGFLYVLFYLTVLISWRTPTFFALDNVDNALNPKLCSALMLQIVRLAKIYGKQLICTTHNPAILDGLNLEDSEQRLYTIRRDSDGHTSIDRVRAPKPQPGELPIRLSEAFLSGNIGGLPEYF